MATLNFHWSTVFDCVMFETDGSDLTQVVYTHEPTLYGPLLSENRAGVEYCHHYDVLGTTVILTNDFDVVTDTFLTDAWGNQVTRTGTTPTSYQWVGRFGYQFDDATCGYYIRAREYIPSIARWLTVDPSDVEDKLNPYLPFSAMPIGFIDPSGLLPDDGNDTDVPRCTNILRNVAAAWAFPFPCASLLLRNFLSGKYNNYCPTVCEDKLRQRGFDYVEKCLARNLTYGASCGEASRLDFTYRGLHDFKGNAWDDFGRAAISVDQDLAYAFGRICWEATVECELKCGSEKQCCCMCDATCGWQLKIRDRYRFCHSNPPGLPKWHPLWCACLLERKKKAKVFNMQCAFNTFGRRLPAITMCSGPRDNCICNTQSSKTAPTQFSDPPIDCKKDSLCAGILSGADW